MGWLLGRAGRLCAYSDCDRRFEIALETLEIRAQVRGGLIAQLPVLFERLVDDAYELGRHGRTDFAERRRRLVQDRVRHLGGGGSSERPPAAGQFVDDDAPRKEVGAEVEGSPQDLLG